MKKIYRQSSVHTFCHSYHPYEPFNITNAKTLIIGSTPPARFALKELQDRDIDWFYGSRHNSFWPLLEQSCKSDTKLNTKELQQDFFLSHNIGIFDTIDECSRTKGCGASDSDLYNIVLTDVLEILRQNKRKTIRVFFSGRFVAELFQKATKVKFDLTLREVQTILVEDKTLHATILYSPSPSWARGLPEQIRKDPNKNELRLKQYSKICTI